MPIKRRAYSSTNRRRFLMVRISFALTRKCHPDAAVIGRPRSAALNELEPVVETFENPRAEVGKSATCVAQAVSCPGHGLKLLPAATAWDQDAWCFIGKARRQKQLNLQGKCIDCQAA